MQENYCFVYLYNESLENKTLNAYESELQQEKVKNYFSEKCGEYRAYLIKQEKKVYLLIYGHLTHFDVSLENAIPEILNPKDDKNYCLSIRDQKCKHYVEKRTRFKRLRSGLNEIFKDSSFALAEIRAIKGNVNKLKEIYSSIRNSNAIKDNDLGVTYNEKIDSTQEVIKLKERMEFLEKTLFQVKKTLEELKEKKEQVQLSQPLIPINEKKEPLNVVHTEKPIIEQKTGDLESRNNKLKSGSPLIIDKPKDLKAVHWNFIETNFVKYKKKDNITAGYFIETLLTPLSKDSHEFTEVIQVSYNSLSRRAEWKEIKRKANLNKK